jgi:membrane protein DedA with SNARE-associated domain
MKRNDEMAKATLRLTSISCLAIWAAIWFLFLAIRFSPLDIRIIPGIGIIMLTALGIALLAPIASAIFAGAALVRQPRVTLNWLTLGCAIAALFGQGLLFIITRWL